VYSSSASLAEAVRVGRGVYHSRSRGGLWRKGDSSGAVQELLALRLDCAADAVLCTVRQRGAPPAFCHLATRSCWGADGGLPALQRVLQARRDGGAAAPPGSYTRRLFDDAALLRSKLLEEAQELAEAADPDHVAAEAADLIYFALVAAVKGGADLADVERHLDRRALKLARRPGNAKPERIAAAERELGLAAAAALSPRL
jgi:phosphoribosyl-ATP pyrophosphohydrolase/phosphoribosyl-AMP cyclohydrolase/histidinol dehydrogenase